MNLRHLCFNRLQHSEINFKFTLLLLFSFLFFSFQSQAKDGYQIKIKFNDVTDSTILLCHYFGKASTVFIDDSTNLNHKGEAVFK